MSPRVSNKDLEQFLEHLKRSINPYDLPEVSKQCQIPLDRIHDEIAKKEWFHDALVLHYNSLKASYLSVQHSKALQGDTSSCRFLFDCIDKARAPGLIPQSKNSKPTRGGAPGLDDFIEEEAFNE